MCQGPDLNWGPMHFQCIALPTELPWRAGLQRANSIAEAVYQIKTRFLESPTVYRAIIEVFSIFADVISAEGIRCGHGFWHGIGAGIALNAHVTDQVQRTSCASDLTIYQRVHAPFQRITFHIRQIDGGVGGTGCLCPEGRVQDVTGRADSRIPIESSGLLTPSRQRGCQPETFADGCVAEDNHAVIRLTLREQFQRLSDLFFGGDDDRVVQQVFGDAAIESVRTGFPTAESAFCAALNDAEPCDVVLIFGSFFLVAEFLALGYPEH